MRFATVFPMLAERRAEALFNQGAFDLLYGYEVHGVLAQRRVRKKHNVPLVSRFQGTIMYPYIIGPTAACESTRR
jgi:hypothetical protein